MEDACVLEVVGSRWLVPKKQLWLVVECDNSVSFFPEHRIGPIIKVPSAIILCVVHLDLVIVVMLDLV